MLEKFKSAQLAKSDEGAAGVEYGLLIAGIAAAIVTTVMLFGPVINDLFADVLSELPPVTP